MATQELHGTHVATNGVDVMPDQSSTKKQVRRVKLTLERINRFACPDGMKQAFLWDEDMRRLAVRATAGSKSFIFEGKLERRTIRRTIGSTDAWTIEDARKEARNLQTLLDQGNDPRELDRQKAEAKRAARAKAEAAAKESERRARYTLRALCDAYTYALDRAGKTKSAKAAASVFACHVAPFEVASKTASEVSSQDVAGLVRRVREAGKERTSGVLRSYLMAAYNAAKRAPFDSALPADLIEFSITHNPVDAIRAIPVNAGKRTLSTDELRAYIGNLRRAGQTTPPNMTDKALMVALLAGGQRMAQLLRATVGDFDPETTTLRLFDAKGKRKEPRVHLVPLGDRTAALVAELVEHAKARTEGNTANAWIFSTRTETQMAVTTPGKRVAEIAAAMGGAFDLRDMRRTVETMLAGMGISKETRAQLLSHGISGVQAAHYDQHDYKAEKRAALAAWESRLEAIERGTVPPANVRTLQRRA